MVVQIRRYHILVIAAVLKKFGKVPFRGNPDLVGVERHHPLCQELLMGSMGKRGHLGRLLISDVVIDDHLDRNAERAAGILEDVCCAVHRPVVSDDERIDLRGHVPQHCGDDVRFVADHCDPDDGHQGTSPRITVSVPYWVAEPNVITVLIANFSPIGS